LGPLKLIAVALCAIAFASMGDTIHRAAAGSSPDQHICPMCGKDHCTCPPGMCHCGKAKP